MITSPSNPRIKLFRSLRQRKQRAASGLFLVEGLHHVGEALAAGVELDCLCYAPSRLTSAFGLSLLEQARQRGLECLEVSDAILDALAEKDNPAGLLAVARRQTVDLNSLNPANFPWGVALVAPQDPGNVGTILRTLDAVGASGLILLDDSVDPTHPSAVRASLGTLFHLPLAQASFAEFAAWAARQPYTLYGASARGSQDYLAVEQYATPRLLVLGSERAGLTAEQQAGCHHLLRLPMRGRASSLNLAVAAGVLLYAMLARS